ncbi:hypothetical protein [Desulfobulbus propionicus]|jgi:hypothetical protein
MIPAVAIPWACDGKQEAGPRNDGCPFFLQMIIREKQHLFKEITFRAILLFDFRTFFVSGDSFAEAPLLGRGKEK